MSKFIIILILAFGFYLFASMDTDGKSQVVQATIAIPQKVITTINDVRDISKGNK